MKAEINNENRGKFHAQYYGQKIILVDMNGDEYENIVGYGDGLFLPSSIFAKYIELTPLSAITDEDAIEYFDILWAKQHKAKSKEFKIEYGKEWALSIEAERFGLIPFGFIVGVDFLRSRGYALPWMGLSVDELIAAGWVKLREV